MIFMRLDKIAGSIYGCLTCEYLLQIAGKVFQQEFIFGQILNDQDWECLKYGHVILSNTKLILFEEILPISFLIPCLTCNTITYIKLPIETSIPVIKELWDIQNRDMHTYKVTVQGSVSGNCSLFHWGYVNLEHKHFCPIATISTKYNLTMIQYLEHSPNLLTYADKSFGVVFKKSDDIGLQNYLYDVQLRYINFLTVTNPPSPSSGVDTFIKPFDKLTWALLLITVILVAGFLSQQEIIHCTGSFAVVDRTITVTCILLGQVGDSTGRAFSSGKVAVILVILWLFGNFLLAANLYQGSIYSLLAVPPQPNIPAGVEDLANWDIPIVAMDSFEENRRLLLNNTIGELISSGWLTPKFAKFLTRFQAKLLSYDDESVSLMVERICRGPGTKQTVAIMKLEDDIGYQVTLIRSIGNRHVVVNRGDTPFRSTLFNHGNKDLLAPYFGKEWGRFSESGLSEKWNSLLKISMILRYKKVAFMETEYFKLTQTWLGDLKEGVPFHEATPVSVDLIRHVFIILAVLVVLGMVCFISENKKFVSMVFKCIDSDTVKIF